MQYRQWRLTGSAGEDAANRFLECDSLTVEAMCMT